MPGSSCPTCRKERDIPRSLVWIGPYAHPFLQKAVRELKFGLRQDLGIMLGELLCPRCPPFYEMTVVSIPLSRRRLLERGFNQAGVIAQTIAARRGWAYAPMALERTRETDPQATLEHEQRSGNIAGAFRVSAVALPQKILLVDDVWTTGSTMEEAIRVLHEAGVKEVYGAVAALG